MITLTTMLGLIMAIVDTSIVNVALTNMAGTLGASIDEIGWVATGYILANVVIMPLNGWLTARFGRRNYYAACIVIFTFSSFLCGTATNVWQLVFYRVIQGLGGGALQPTAQAILFESYPPDKRSGAMAIFGLGAMVGPAIGPVLGGIIVDNYSWPLIFFINLPIGIIAFFMTLRYIRDPTYIKRDDSRIDWLGLGMMTAGLASLQYVLERGQHDDWFSSMTIVVMSLIAFFGITTFIVRELRVAFPLVDLSVFGSGGFTAGNIIGVISGFGLYGLNLVIPLFLQNVLGLTATLTGLALLPGALATALSMPIAGRLAKWLDPRASIAFGLAMFAAGSWMLGYLSPDAGIGAQIHLLAAHPARIRTRFSVRSAHDRDAGRRSALTHVERDGSVYARAPTRRRLRNRDPAVRSAAVGGRPLHGAGVGRDGGESHRRRPAAWDRRRHCQLASAGRNRHAQCRGVVVQRRLQAVRDRLRAVDSDRLSARRQAGGGHSGARRGGLD